MQPISSWPEFDKIEGERSNILVYVAQHPHQAYARDELLRFISMAGALRHTFPNPTGSGDERAMTHVVLRSLLESLFWILYIYEPQAVVDRDLRYQKQVNEFQRQYAKMLNDPHLPLKSRLPSPGNGWAAHPAAPDLASILNMQRHVSGQRMDFLYFTYRVTSFDTHGRTAPALLEQSFGAPNSNFPYLKLKELLEYMSEAYSAIWHAL